MILTFTIGFHGPFRIATGRAGDGADIVVDRSAPLPASSLKGVMRATARDLLRLPAAIVDAVYGTAWQPCPWSWSDATLTTTPAIRARARIQIDDVTHTAVDGALAIGEEILADQAIFTVTATSAIPADDIARHQAVLTGSARAVTALGGDRRRALGWVSITPQQPPWTTESARTLAEQLSAMRREEPS